MEHQSNTICAEQCRRESIFAYLRNGEKSGPICDLLTKEEKPSNKKGKEGNHLAKNSAIVNSEQTLGGMVEMT